MWKADVLPALQATFRLLEQPVDGWLVFDFRSTNPVMATVVGPETVGVRRSYVYITDTGFLAAVVHAVDAELWHEWPAGWPKVVWTHRSELAHALVELVGGQTVAMEYSPGGLLPYVDHVPAGVIEFIRSVGARPVTSAELVSRY